MNKERLVAEETGEVVLVGGGPGDPDLMTIAGLRELRSADVVLYDHLAPRDSLSETRPGAILVDVGKIPGEARTSQEDINRMCVDYAREGHKVVRLKGGDPYVFGRGGEESLACAEAGVPVRVIPGVSSAVAGPALSGIPVTHRGLSQSVTIVSGHVAPDDPRSTTNWEALANSGGTIVILMGVRCLREICDTLTAKGLDPETPAATIVNASAPDSRVIRATVRTLPELTGGVRPPALTVVGAVAGLNLAAES